jgi:hypothetical protein
MWPNRKLLDLQLARIGSLPLRICRFSEQLNRLLIVGWHIRYPPIRAASY